MPATRQIKPQVCRWHSFGSAAELERVVVDEIQRLAQQAIAKRGSFNMVLAGGTTPGRIYAALRHIQTDWDAWHIYFGDERCLPVEHPERNSRMAQLAWLDHVRIPAAQIHPIPAEKGPVVAAREYEGTVKRIATFDLVLLGLGEDGHTASLFPGHELGEMPDAPVALPVFGAPKPPPERVSLSAYRLSAAHEVFYLVTGTSKVQAVKDWRSGKSIPASIIAPDAGVDVYIEHAALRASA